jgi:hypothetical protein
MKATRAILPVAAGRFKMSVRGRAERQSNVASPVAFSGGDRRDVPAPRNDEPIARDKLTDPRITVRVSLRDSSLMVGG